MSYILDALQKSEQERQQQVMPDVHAAAPVAPTTRHWWPWVAAIGLLLLSINMAALWYWLTPSTESTTATAGSVTDATLDTTADPFTDSTVDREVQTRDLIVSAPQHVTPAEFTDLDSLRAITPVRITALPVDIQQQIPSLTFSSHLYSDDFRMVNINGRMMRESEYIGAELQLIEITEDGVILRFREYYVQMSILQNWSFD
ncbi:MAG: general secretion pathway protein B [Candidatus Azotimanducaceae bacterium]|jgi:general secretion pathway protein B